MVRHTPCSISTPTTLTQQRGKRRSKAENAGESVRLLRHRANQRCPVLPSCFDTTSAYAAYPFVLAPLTTWHMRASSRYLYENKEKRKTGSSDLVRPRSLQTDSAETHPLSLFNLLITIFSCRTLSTSTSKSTHYGSKLVVTTMLLFLAILCTTRQITGIRR